MRLFTLIMLKHKHSWLTQSRGLLSTHVGNIFYCRQRLLWLLRSPTCCACHCFPYSTFVGSSDRGPRDIVLSLKETFFKYKRINRIDFDAVLTKTAMLDSSTGMVLLQLCGKSMAGESASVKATLVDIIIDRLWRSEVLGIEHYNAAILTYLENNFSFSPIELLKKMESLRLEPNLITFSRFVHRYCVLGDLAAAVSMIELMKAKGFTVDERVQASLLYGYLKAKDLENFHKALDVMKQCGLVPGFETFIQIAEGSAIAGDVAQLDFALTSAANCHPIQGFDFVRLLHASLVSKHNDCVEKIWNLFSRLSDFVAYAVNLLLDLLSKQDDTAFLHLLKLLLQNSRLKETDKKLLLEELVLTLTSQCTLDPGHVIDLLKEIEYVQRFPELLLSIVEKLFSHNRFADGSCLLQLYQSLGGRLTFEHFVPLLSHYAATNDEKVLFQTLCWMHKTNVSIDFENFGNKISASVGFRIQRLFQEVKSIDLELKKQWYIDAQDRHSPVSPVHNVSTEFTAQRRVPMQNIENYSMQRISSLNASNPSLAFQISANPQRRNSVVPSRFPASTTSSFPHYQNSNTIQQGAPNFVQQHQNGVVPYLPCLPPLRQKCPHLPSNNVNSFSSSFVSSNSPSSSRLRPSSSQQTTSSVYCSSGFNTVPQFSHQNSNAAWPAAPVGPTSDMTTSSANFPEILQKLFIGKSVDAVPAFIAKFRHLLTLSDFENIARFLSSEQRDVQAAEVFIEFCSRLPNLENVNLINSIARNLHLQNNLDILNKLRASLPAVMLESTNVTHCVLHLLLHNHGMSQFVLQELESNPKFLFQKVYSTVILKMLVREKSLLDRVLNLIRNAPLHDATRLFYYREVWTELMLMSSYDVADKLLSTYSEILDDSVVYLLSRAACRSNANDCVRPCLTRLPDAFKKQPKLMGSLFSLMINIKLDRGDVNSALQVLREALLSGLIQETDLKTKCLQRLEIAAKQRQQNLASLSVDAATQQGCGAETASAIESGAGSLNGTTTTLNEREIVYPSGAGTGSGSQSGTGTGTQSGTTSFNGTGYPSRTGTVHAEAIRFELRDSDEGIDLSFTDYAHEALVEQRCTEHSAAFEDHGLSALPVKH